MRHLPQCDRLDLSDNQGKTALITDDGTSTTLALARSLWELGYKVTILCFPETQLSRCTSLPPEVDCLTLSDWSKQLLQEKLSQIGTVDVFIHLHPHTEEIYSVMETVTIAQIFAIAKYLQPSLTRAVAGRNAFLTVTRLDGELGLGNQHDYGAIGGGLFGLTKSLSREWNTVFCRAIDLKPDIDAIAATRQIIDELHDPNLLITEVGYGDRGRVTIDSEH